MTELLRWHQPTRVSGGIGLLESLRDEIARAGARRWVLVTDSGIRKAGLVYEVTSRAGVPFRTVYERCVPNAAAHSVAELAQSLRDLDADGIVALGGGSVMDTAKAANLLVTLGGPNVLIHATTRLQHPLKLRLVCIPTTAGTGSEVSGGAVVHDTHRKAKVVFGSPFLAPDAALLLPELTLAMPPLLTAATGFDALTHAIEAYLSNRANPFSDALALQAARMIAWALPAVMERPADLKARYEMQMAAAMAGQAFNSGGLGVCHAIAHALGGHFEVPHGVANALMLPEVMRFNREGREERYARLAEALGRPDAIAAVEDLRTALGLPERLSQAGAWADPALVALAMADPLVRHNHRPVTPEVITSLLREVT